MTFREIKCSVFSLPSASHDSTSEEFGGQGQEIDEERKRSSIGSTVVKSRMKATVIDLEFHSLRTLYTHSCVTFSILFVRFLIQLEKNRDKNQERCLGMLIFLGGKKK